MGARLFATHYEGGGGGDDDGGASGGGYNINNDGKGTDQSSSSRVSRDILRNVSCRPHYIQDKFSDLPNCSDVEAVKRINSNLDLENTFSKFKSFHKKPCANVAMTYQQKFKVLSFCIK